MIDTFRLEVWSTLSNQRVTNFEHQHVHMLRQIPINDFTNLMWLLKANVNLIRPSSKNWNCGIVCVTVQSFCGVYALQQLITDVDICHRFNTIKLWSKLLLDLEWLANFNLRKMYIYFASPKLRYCELITFVHISCCLLDSYVTSYMFQA